MAISATTVWEARTTGLSTNGGGFDPVTGAGAVDYSLQDSPQLALVDIAIANNTTTTITSATGGFTSNMVGNIIYLTGGSGGTLATQRREIISVTNTNTAVLDQAPAPSAAMTGVTGNLGGALSAPWDVYSSTAGSNDFVIGNTLYIKSGTYVRTTVWIGKDVGNPATLSNRTNIVGYDTDRSLSNKDTNRPVITTSTNSTVLFQGVRMTGYTFVKNLIFTNTATTRAAGITNITTASSAYWINCKFEGFTSAFSQASSSANQINAILINCEIANCTSHGISMGTNSGGWVLFGCYIHDNGGSGVNSGSGTASISCVSCIIVNNASSGVHFSTTSFIPSGIFYDCVIANNTSSQLLFSVLSDPPSSSTTISFISNNIFYGGQYGIGLLSNGQYALTDLTIGRYYFLKNAFGGSSIANRSNCNSVSGDIDLTTNPFIDSANRDYRLNKIAGGGLLCAGTGSPAFIEGLESIISYPDIGAYRYQPTTLVS